jgi:pimeloyl-ACP methyl ester carboxylesterase
MSQPTLVLVHGAWHGPDHFGPLREYLEKRGYKCVAVNLPSVIRSERDEIPKSLDPDIQAIRKTVTKELKDGNVYMVAHSYGAVPTMSALDGLDRRSRNEAGQSTYITGIACIAAFVLLPGASLLDACGGSPAPIHDIQGDLLHVNEPGPTYWFYQDLPAEEADKWTQLLKPQAWGVNEDKSRSAAYEVIPTTYLVTRNDAAFPVEIQRGLVAAASARGLQIKTEEIDSSHSPFLSRVEETGDFIMRSVEGKV